MSGCAVTSRGLRSLTSASSSHERLERLADGSLELRLKRASKDPIEPTATECRRQLRRLRGWRRGLLRPLRRARNHQSQVDAVLGVDGDLPALSASFVETKTGIFEPAAIDEVDLPVW
jgi:hypothetical protein